jgi:hypothetical protein
MEVIFYRPLASWKPEPLSGGRLGTVAEVMITFTLLRWIIFLVVIILVGFGAYALFNAGPLWVIAALLFAILLALIAKVR